MVRAGGCPRNEGGPQPPAPPLLQTASPYDRSGFGWGQNAVGARSASSDETLRLARWQGPSPGAVRAALRAMIDAEDRDLYLCAVQRSSKSACSLTSST